MTGDPRRPIERRLRYSAPFDSANALAFLGLRAVPGVEEVTGGVYRRSLRLPHGHGVVELEPADGHVRARFVLDEAADLEPALARCRALLDLDCDPDAVAAALGGDRLIGPLVTAAPGVRVVGHVDGHELAIRAVLGQQVSVAGARTITARIVGRHGETLARPVGGVTHVFPSVQAIAAIAPEDLPMPRSRSTALTTLAAAIAAGRVTLDPSAELQETRRRLLELPGIGPWTVEYVAMRALGDRDAFMASDLGVRHALVALGEDGRPDAAARIAQRWRPFRAYALAHLWATLAPAP